MNCLFDLRLIFAYVAKIIFKFCWVVKCFLAFVTLISTSIRIGTIWTYTTNKSISKPQITVIAIALSHLLCFYFSFIVNIHEDFLSDFGVPFSACSTKIIEANIKPFINFFMNFIIKVTNLLRRFFFFHSLYLCCCTILVSSTNIKHIRSL